MSIILSRPIFLLLSLATFTMLGSGSAAANSAPTPVPGTTVTSATSLTLEAPRTPQQVAPAKTAAPRVSQVDIDPGQTTQSGASYIGIAGNIGISGGDTALGDSNFAVISKVGLTNRISVRPGAVISGDNSTVLLPVTYDFSFNPVDAFSAPLPFAPYAGVGIAITTGDGADVGPMLTAGVDFPLTPQFTATAAFNVGFVEDTSTGLLIGVGYNFGNLF